MGKIEYDVYADGKKIGTASRDQTEFEKALDEAVTEARYHDAFAKRAEKLANEYAHRTWTYVSPEKKAIWRLEEKIEKGEEIIRKNRVPIVLYLATALSWLVFGISPVSVILLVATLILRYFTMDFTQRVIYAVIISIGVGVASLFAVNGFVAFLCIFVAADFLFLLGRSAIIYFCKDKRLNDLIEKRKKLEESEKK